MSFETKAHAKVNLWLDITGRRADGYHLLRTVMRSVDLYDVIGIELNDSGKCSISCQAPGVPNDGRNIASKAFALFGELYGGLSGAHISIEKNIPCEAGLGGSSTDGAAVLTGLNELFGCPFTKEELAAAGSRIGADVPFCVTGGTAVCTGIGERIEPAVCADFSLLIVKPGFSCSTAAAYRAYDESPSRAPREGFDSFVDELEDNIASAAGKLYNVFGELYADERIERIKARLVEAGAHGACMSGSGSAVFGIFPDLRSAQAASAAFADMKTFAVNAL